MNENYFTTDYPVNNNKGCMFTTAHNRLYSPTVVNVSDQWQMGTIVSLEPQKDRSRGAKRREDEKRKKEKKKGREKKRKSEKEGKEARCKSSFHFPFLLSWMDLGYWRAGWATASSNMTKGYSFIHYQFFSRAVPTGAHGARASIL
jgi:hypothetical protein